MQAETAAIPGLGWYGNGQSVLSGALLGLYRDLDDLFLRWSARVQAEEFRYPTFIPVSALQRIGYFQSFPHLATFPVTIPRDDARLREFAAGATSSTLELGACPCADVLTPAACYHVYIGMSGRQLNAPAWITTVNTCFRREDYYRPLERQWSFSMREIICLGDGETVAAFAAGARRQLSDFLARIGLPVAWQTATDPFFDPKANAKYVMQKIDPVKTELVFGDQLAIGSINLHRQFFGSSFGISLAGAPIHSACVAFGLERWLKAFVTTFGHEAAKWPRLRDLDIVS
jgi:hypothetical protein